MNADPAPPLTAGQAATVGWSDDLATQVNDL
jgi:hypothetical protein